MKDVIVPSVGNKVVVSSDDDFDKAEGVVLDLDNNELPVEGNIAVYFGFGNKEFLFGFSDEHWKGPEPTPENYKDCPRVRVFFEKELTVLEDFSLGYKATLLYPRSFQHSLSKPNFPLEPGKHLCHFAFCKSEKPLATHKTIMNCWGHITEFYTCEECHTSYNTMCCDSFPELKNPVKVEISN